MLSPKYKPFFNVSMHGDYVKLNRRTTAGGSTDLTSASKFLLGTDFGLGMRMQMSNQAALVLFSQWNFLQTRNESFELEGSSLVFQPEFNAAFISFGLGLEMGLTK